MANYTIVIGKSASKELAKLPLEVIDRIQLAINALTADPRPATCKKLKGFKDLYRIRSGDYGVIYKVEDQLLIIDVVRIGNRKDIYS